MPVSPSNETISTLLLVKPGRTHDGLNILLQSLPEVRFTQDERYLATPLLSSGEPIVDCVILDCPDGDPEPCTLNWISELRRKHPQIRCIIMTTAATHTPAYLSAGANQVLIHGFTLRELRESLSTKLLQNPPIQEQKLNKQPL